MPFFRGTVALAGTLVYDTGSYIRFRTSQLGSLPRADVDCPIRLPDGAVVVGRFHMHPQNPYIGGRALVGWIKGWLAFGDRADVILEEGVGPLRLRIIAPAQATDQQLRTRVAARSRTLLALPSSVRRRRTYSAWERNPLVRRLVLETYGPDCQVARCLVQSHFPAVATVLIADVHHLDAVSVGGSDSPLNLAVLCVAHHVLVHRGQSRMLETGLDGAVIESAAGPLEILRDARVMMAV
jgi:hypothetical protein